MDQGKQAGSDLTARSASWHEFITFLTDDLFYRNVCDFIRNHRPNLAPVQDNERVLNTPLEDWEWRLFDTCDAIKAYIKQEGHLIPQYLVKCFSQAGNAFRDLFWCEIKLKYPELSRPDNIGVRADESGNKVLVGIQDNNVGMAIGPFKIGPQE